MASSDKQMTLIRQLVELTKRGDLHWAKTFQPDTLAVAFPTLGIRISGERATIGMGLYSLRIYDGSGNVTLEIEGRHPNFTTAHAENTPMDVRKGLAELYEEAYQVANVPEDRVIDETLTKLGQVIASGSKAS